MIRCSFLAWVITGSVAFAADLNQDGCQDEYAANGACVDVDATVDASTTVGANALVFTGASVGPEVALGADVVLGARASLAGRVAHTSNPLPIGAGTVIGRSAQLGVDHSIGSDVTIGRAALAGARLTIANGGSLGYAAQVGDDVNIGASAVVGNLATLGNFATLGDNAAVARSVTIADGLNSGNGASVSGVVGPGVLIAAGSRIEQGARVRKQASIGAGAAIEASGRVGRDAIIEAGATVYGRVGANATVRTGATVGAGARVGRGAEVCEGASVPEDDVVASDGLFPEDGCASPLSCKALLDDDPSVTSGVYSIDADGTGPKVAFDAYCDMDTDGGGWTLTASVVSQSSLWTAADYTPSEGARAQTLGTAALDSNYVLTTGSWSDLLGNSSGSSEVRVRVRTLANADVTLGRLTGMQMAQDGTFTTNPTAAFKGNGVQVSPATSACVIQYNSNFLSTITNENFDSSDNACTGSIGWNGICGYPSLGHAAPYYGSGTTSFSHACSLDLRYYCSADKTTGSGGYPCHFQRKWYYVR
ncbi:MAG: UDP-3-O-[3-hydroxymyristoyl] glucosamine N-acyltransferase [Myxococcota bacterium]|jgi:UDP-3-O-[3-hydroxymyristoyl] glucosamine N-acyltransferase